MKYKKTKIRNGVSTAITLCFLLFILEISAFPTPLPDDQFTIIDSYGNGYLAENSDGKRLLHVEGSPYEIGYQHGRLCGQGAQRLTSIEYFIAVAEYLMQVDLSEIDDTIVDFMTWTLFNIAKSQLHKIPDEFKEEMQGIADGATDAGYDLTFDDLLKLNLGVDCSLCIGYPLMIAAPELITLITNLQIETPNACNGFVAHGNATTGSVLMGRHFMFASDTFHEEALIIECVPENGNKFINVAASGFVGVVSGMNSRGIGIGVDVVASLDVNMFKIGMGSGFVSRKTIQYANELSEAVNIIKNIERGIPWLYILADGQGSDIGGAVIECSAHRFKVRYSNYRYPRFWKMFNLPRQIEKKNDLVVVTNHFIIPEMFIFSSNDIYTSSVWRYETLTNLLLDSYGCIDVEKAREINDFLHPPNYDYYGSDPDLPVEASVTLFDLTNTEVWSLFGLYSDPWMYYKLD